MIVFGKERDYVIHDENNVKGFFGEYRWLSNYHECEIKFDGINYPSTENAYQSAKSNDMFVKHQMTQITPSESKQLSTKLQLRDNWHNIKYDIMSYIIFDKFYRHLDLRQKLLDTGSKYLEETNHWGDRYWGVCDGKGENNLGKILMGIRKFWQDKVKDKPKQLF